MMSSSGTASVSPVPSVFDTAYNSSATSRSRNLSGNRPRPRGVRTNIACKACQKRKTKCSGGPAPCVLCTKFATHCHFNPKLDTRRKVSYKSSEKHDIRGYILESTLQVLKRGNAEGVESLLRIIRSDASIEDIARSFQQNFKMLQNRGVIPPFKIDESDIISLALQGLFPYRVGCVQGDIESDTETVHVPQSSRSERTTQYCDFAHDTYGIRHGQKPQQFQEYLSKSPMSDHPASNATTLSSNSFNTAYSSFSDEFSDFPPTPISQSPHYYFDGAAAHSQPHLTPYSSSNQGHHPNGQGQSFPPNVPVLVSQPLLEKPNLQQNLQALPPNWPQHMPVGAPNMQWHPSNHSAVTSPGVPIQLVPHNESVYGGWPS